MSVPSLWYVWLLFLSYQCSLGDGLQAIVHSPWVLLLDNTGQEYKCKCYDIVLYLNFIYSMQSKSSFIR